MFIAPSKLTANLPRGQIDPLGRAVGVRPCRSAGIRDQQIDRVLAIELAEPCCHRPCIRHVDSGNACWRPFLLAGMRRLCKAPAITAEQAEAHPVDGVGLGQGSPEAARGPGDHRDAEGRAHQRGINCPHPQHRHGPSDRNDAGSNPPGRDYAAAPPSGRRQAIEIPFNSPSDLTIAPALSTKMLLRRSTASTGPCRSEFPA